MCTRYTIASSVEAIEKEFQAEFQFTFGKVYNAHFGMELPVICSGEENKVRSYRWGMVPFWSKEPNLKFHNINSPAREIVKNPVFKIPVRRRRCLVPANCFFIWHNSGAGKTIYVVYDSRHRLLSLAGIWDTWQNAEKTSLVHSFSIITIGPSKRLAPFTGQMPVIIPESRRRKYLRQSIGLMEVMQMLRPYESDSLNLYPVSQDVNNFHNNSREILLPIGERVYKEVVYEPKVYLKLEGMGSMKDNPDRLPQLKLMI